jgi:hypothetical protein
VVQHGHPCRVTHGPIIFLACLFHALNLISAHEPANMQCSETYTRTCQVALQDCQLVLIRSRLDWAIIGECDEFQKPLCCARTHVP